MFEVLSVKLAYIHGEIIKFTFQGFYASADDRKLYLLILIGFELPCILFEFSK